MKYSDLVEIYEELEATTKRLEKTHCLAELIRKTHAKDFLSSVNLPETLVKIYI